MEEEQTSIHEQEPQVRPEDMIPYVKEYLGLLEEKRLMETEMKRAHYEFKERKKKMMEKMEPVKERFDKVEMMLKKLIMTQKLPGVKYKQYIFTLEEKPVFKDPMEKIKEALEKNPVERFQHNRQALAQIIADSVKRKVRDHSVEVKTNPSTMCLKIRVLPN